MKGSHRSRWTALCVLFCGSVLLGSLINRGKLGGGAALGTGVHAASARGPDLESDAYLSADAASLFLGEWWVDRIRLEVDHAQGGTVNEYAAGCEHWFVFGRSAAEQHDAEQAGGYYGMAIGTVMRYAADGSILPDASIHIRAHSQNDSEILVAGFGDELEQAHGSEQAVAEHLPFLSDVHFKRTWYSKTRYASGRWQLSAEHGTYELLFADNNHFSIHLRVESEEARGSSTLVLMGTRATTMEELREMTGGQLKPYIPLILILVVVFASRLVRSKTASAPPYKPPGAASSSDAMKRAAKKSR